MMSMVVGALSAIGIVIVVAACGEPTLRVPPGGSQDRGVLWADTVTRTDASLWRHRPTEERGVRVTIGIPAGMDSVVIMRVDGHAELGRDSVQLLEVNSVRVRAPLRLRRISVRSVDGDQMNVELIVKAGHCTRLDLVAVRYWNGGPADGIDELLPQKHQLPDCCFVSSASEAVEAPDVGATDSSVNASALLGEKE